VIGLVRSEAGAVGQSSGAIFVKGSLSDRSFLRQMLEDYAVDVIFHLAAQPKVDVARRDPAATFEANVSGTWNVLDAVRSVGRRVRVIVASTDTVYKSGCTLPYTEDSETDAASPYAASKLCAEMVAKCYREASGIPVCVVRTSNLYGGGDFSFERIIPGTIRSVLRDEAPVINGDGRAQRDYLYIEDAIAGYLLLAEAMEEGSIGGETFNFGSGVPVSVAAVVDAILEVMQRKDLAPKVLGKPNGENSVRYVSAAKAERKLGWRAETTLRAGLTKTISWYQAHESVLRVEAQN
jgi:CDP-glucose 4,6-dehydratase